MEWWQLLTTIFGVLGMVYAGLHVYFKNKSQTKVESFKSIMEESKKFRDEFRAELSAAKEEIAKLKKQVADYETEIEKLKKQITPPTWLYYYLQKPIKLFELDTIVKRHITEPTDRILLIEDDPFTQKVLESVSTANGWNLLRVSNGKSAIETLKLHVPKLIIIDLVLAVPDAFEALNAIHESTELSGVPIVVISSSNVKEVDRIFLHTKIHEALTKA